MLPVEHGGVREDGQPDKRTQQTEFAYGKVDPSEAGREGGSATGNPTSSSGGSGGSGGSGDSGRGGSGGSAKGEFAHGKVDPHEAGHAGGSK